MAATTRPRPGIGNRFGKAAYGPLDACEKVAEFRGNYWDGSLQPLNQ